MVSLADAAVPDGCRIYAIGDVHGCLDKLEAVESLVRADLAAKPPGEYRTVLIGDYIDRGPDSRGVLLWLANRWDELRLRPLIGNHEAMMQAFLADPGGGAHSLWLSNGGMETLASFGLSPADPFAPVGRAQRIALRDRLAEEIAGPLAGVLDSLSLMESFGDYVFVHAGLRPGRPLQAQSAEDLIWIREGFLGSDADFGAVVIHGHTPTPRLDVKDNRIGIDTGAVFGGPLTCLVLEGRDRWQLTSQGRSSVAR